MTPQRIRELTETFEKRYSEQSLADLKDRLSINMRKVLAMIDTVSDRELFEPHMRRWIVESTRSGDWTMARMIHINTVAPMKSFRTKIRKWKKAVPLA